MKLILLGGRKTQAQFKEKNILNPLYILFTESSQYIPESKGIPFPGLDHFI
jgi:hypothetical protein